MINGYKPNGYFTTGSDWGRQIQGETRQCVHCQFVWRYNPGSGDVRGYCTRHDGFVCNREQCYRTQRERIASLGDWPFGCISFNDYNAYQFEKLLGNRKYEVTTAGVFVPVTE